jgi:hypothetical protein
MLRRAEKCSLLYRRGFLGLGGRLYFQVGRQEYPLGKFDQLRVDQLRQEQWARPLFVAEIGDRTYWQFRDRFYWDNDGLNVDQIYAVLVTRLQREHATVERAQAMVATGMQPRPNPRGAIPDDVKQLVWIRDGGRCRACGTQVELQFDHVIPIAFGGASTPENLQVLCGPCNRRKGAGITTP